MVFEDIILMTFTDILNSITALLAEANKAEDNAQLKKFTSALRKLQREIEKQRKTARRNLVIGIIISLIGSSIATYFIGNFP